MKNLLILPAFFSLFFSCASYQVKTADRPEFASGTDTVIVTRSEKKAEQPLNTDKNAIPLITDSDLKKYSFELGFNPEKGLSDEEKKQISSRYKVRSLERMLDSEKERRHYSKVLPYLLTDQEKVDYLSNPTMEGRQAWVIRNKIWSRSKVDKEFLDVVDAQDLTLGMTQDLVKKSWGDPESVEFSGNPVYRNEKWRYLRDVPSPNGYKRERRFVFFEGGRVVGWETE